MSAPLREKPSTTTRPAVVISVKKEQFREGLFKYIDKAPKKYVFVTSPSKRVIDPKLFDHIQSKVDTYARARISLVELGPNKSMSVTVADTKPMSAEYDEILRRLRFGDSAL